MMQEVEVLKTIPELVCSYFSEEQFTLSRKRGIIAPQFALCYHYIYLTIYVLDDIYKTIYTILCI